MIRQGTKAEYLQAITTPHASPYHMSGARTHDTEWTRCGTFVASKSTVYARKGSNKVASESFMINDEFLTPTEVLK